MYDVSLKNKWDNKAVLDYVKEVGRKEEAVAIARLTIAKTLLGRKYEHDRITRFIVFLKNFCILII